MSAFLKTNLGVQIGDLGSHQKVVLFKFLKRAVLIWPQARVWICLKNSFESFLPTAPTKQLRIKMLFPVNGGIIRKITNCPRLLLVKENSNLFQFFWTLEKKYLWEMTDVKTHCACKWFCEWQHMYYNLAFFFSFLCPHPQSLTRQNRWRGWVVDLISPVLLLVKSANRIHLDKVKDCAFNVELSE